MVDFVELQKAAADYMEDHLPQQRIATAWPYTSALQNRDFGYVHRPLPTVETKDFSPAAVRAVPRDSYDVLVVYTRTWAPVHGITALPWVRSLLERYYDFKPEIDEAQCSSSGCGLPFRGSAVVNPSLFTPAAAACSSQNPSAPSDSFPNID